MRKKATSRCLVSVSRARDSASASASASRLGDRGTGTVAGGSPELVATSASAESAESGGLLVVVELGGAWPSVATTEPSARRVVAQREGETPAALAERFANGLDSLFGRGVRLQTVMLACNERVDEGAEAARRKILSLALGSMAKHQSGRVYLAASSLSGGRLRHALSALAQGLFEEWRTAGLRVSVDFGEENGAEQRTTPFAFTSRVA